MKKTSPTSFREARKSSPIPNDTPYPSRLLLGWAGTRPIHVVAAHSNREIIIITVYEPDPVLWQPGFLGERTERDLLKRAEVAAQALGVRPQFVDARNPADFGRAFAEMTRVRAGALTVLSSSMFFKERRRLIELAAKNRLPTLYPTREGVDAGGLMSYGPDLLDLDRRAAVYVDKILKGAKPADLAVEGQKKFELVINLKTAQQIGLTIPPALLKRADKIIK